MLCQVHLRPIEIKWLASFFAFCIDTLYHLIVRLSNHDKSLSKVEATGLTLSTSIVLKVLDMNVELYVEFLMTNQHKKGQVNFNVSPNAFLC